STQTPSVPPTSGPRTVLFGSGRTRTSRHTAPTEASTTAPAMTRAARESPNPRTSAAYGAATGAAAAAVATSQLNAVLTALIRARAGRTGQQRREADDEAGGDEHRDRQTPPDAAWASNRPRRAGEEDRGAADPDPGVDVTVASSAAGDEQEDHADEQRRDRQPGAQHVQSCRSSSRREIERQRNHARGCQHSGDRPAEAVRDGRYGRGGHEGRRNPFGPRRWSVRESRRVPPAGTAR